MSFLNKGNIIFSKGFLYIVPKIKNDPPVEFRYRKLGEMLNMTLGEMSNMTIEDLVYVKENGLEGR